MSEEMEGIPLNLNKRQGAIVLMVLAGLVIFQCVRTKSNLGPEVARPIESYLGNIYSGRALSDLERMKRGGLDEREIERILEGGRDLLNIEVTEMTARLTPDGYVVKATYTVGGKAPPDGIDTRYFQMNRLLGDRWSVEHETSAFFYHLGL